MGDLMGRYIRFAASIAAGLFVYAFVAANFGESGPIIGAVFGLAAAYLGFEFLTRRSEAHLTRDKARNYE